VTGLVHVLEIKPVSHMKHNLALVMLFVALGSCATTPHTSLYGPQPRSGIHLATHRTTKADLFYLDGIDGKGVRNAFDETLI